MPLRRNALGKEMQRQSFQGIGKPEPLRQALAGCRSRRGRRTQPCLYGHGRGSARSATSLSWRALKRGRVFPLDPGEAYWLAWVERPGVPCWLETTT
ncbi:MAG: type II toxin-antitoxin system YoeB family toxin [Thermodesulfobacteriota bacterium]